jgi:hypothetical protein
MRFRSKAGAADLLSGEEGEVPPQEEESFGRLEAQPVKQSFAGCLKNTGCKVDFVPPDIISWFLRLFFHSHKAAGPDA